MFSVDLSTREWDGHVVVSLGGELDLVVVPLRRADDRQGWPGFAVSCPRHGETRSGHGGPLPRLRG
jgi:hypothetical protein